MSIIGWPKHSEEISGRLGWAWAPQLALRPNGLFKIFTSTLNFRIYLSCGQTHGQETRGQKYPSPCVWRKREQDGCTSSHIGVDSAFLHCQITISFSQGNRENKEEQIILCLLREHASILAKMDISQLRVSLCMCVLQEAVSSLEDLKF